MRRGVSGSDGRTLKSGRALSRDAIWRAACVFKRAKVESGSRGTDLTLVRANSVAVAMPAVSSFLICPTVIFATRLR